MLAEEREWSERRGEEVPADVAGKFLEKYGFWFMVLLSGLLILKIVRG